MATRRNLHAEMVNTVHRQILAVAGIAAAIPVEDAEAVVAEIDNTETVMPIVDPTGWMRIQRTVPGHKEVCEAFLAFRRRLAALGIGEGLEEAG